MDNRHRECLVQYRQVEKEIEDIENALRMKKDLRRVLESYVMVFEGSCELCQNAHWPHCTEED